MSLSASAPVDVDAGGVKIQSPHREHRYHCERFVNLPKVDVRCRPACFGEQLLHCTDRRQGKGFRRQAVSCMADDARPWRQAV